LITSAGRRVSLVKSFQKILKKYNIEGKVYTTDMNPILSSACQASDGFIEVPRVTDKSYLDVLKQICIEKKISIVVPTIDTELSLLAEVKKEFLNIGVFLAVSEKYICDTFYLKDTTERFFIDNGFDTPKIVDINNCEYPIFAKLNNSSCSIGATIVYNKEQAEELSLNSNYIFQEFIDADEYTIDLFIDKNSKVISIVPRLRIEVRAGEVSKAKTVKDREIIDSIKQLASKLDGAYGCITVQLFKKEDRIVFIEINPRFGGGYPLSYLSGANFADYLIKDYLNIDLEYNENWKENNIMLRYDSEIIIDGNSI
jgi:carbamoyl-phosphate synthase large subunit